MKVGLLKNALKRNLKKPVMLMSAHGTLFTALDASAVSGGIIDINALDDVSVKTIRAERLIEQLELSEIGITDDILFSDKKVCGWLSNGQRHQITKVQLALGGKIIVLIMNKSPITH